MLFLKTSVLLCMLCCTGAQLALKLNNINHVATFLSSFCGDIASFIPSACGVAAVGPACCGLFVIVDTCRSSCASNRLSTSYGIGSQEVERLMYDPQVCSALRLTGQTQCVGHNGWSLQCDRLRCLMNMMCFPLYSFACYYTIINTYIGGNSGSNGNGNGGNGGGVRGNEGDRPGKVQNNCFELPELADGELTGLIDDRESQLRQCPHNPHEPDCKGNKEKNKLRYRTIDGSCNNLKHPRWGKSFEPQKRLLPSQLVAGKLPRNHTRHGKALPEARYISRIVSPDMDHFVDVSNMVMAWGQFIDHDFTGTPVTKNGTQAIKCCGDIDEDLKVENGGPCFPIRLENDDPFGSDCMQFVRSLPYSHPNGTEAEPREQINTLTSFLDASAVYGNTQEVLDKLKENDGTMKVAANNMLPENTNGTCKKETKGDYCLLAGDHRVNVFVALGALHTAFVREHNRIANTFKVFNPSWDNETIFQETRRIVSAQFQHVTYAEWLPLILGEATMSKYRLKTGDYFYDPDVNPTISNVFSTASFRFGHSQVKQNVKIGPQNLPLQDTLMRPRYALHNMTDAIRGIVSAHTNDVDEFFADGLTNHMFETNSTAKDGLDLVSINIQRGRDHGLPPFNEWRKFCGLPRITDFNTRDFKTDLSSAYKETDDVDVFVGLVTETHIPGSLVGPTLACLLGVQFHDIKFGDRFFYETRVPQERFTEDQLREIKTVTLAKILCDNNPDLKEIQRNVFRVEHPVTNPSVPCNKIPGINLDFWKSL